MKLQLPTIHTNLTEDDWHQLRSSRFTASEIHKLMGTPKNKSEYLSETAKTFIFEKAAEYLTGQKAEMYGRALDWGKEHEKEAFEYFSQQTDDFYTYYGAETYTFITYGEWGGYSPDALGTHLVEIKCPFNSGNHLQNSFITNNEQLKSKRPEYYWQVQMGMVATEMTEALFLSYDPRMPIGKKLTQTLITLEEDIQEIIDEKLASAGELFLSITK
jgi:putative phage-type endonuclease